jgi:ribose transport system permease protein
MNKKLNISELLKTYGTVVSGIIIIIAFSILRPDAFFTISNFINITRQISLLVVIALGATLVMCVDEFDLSVGALASLGGVIDAKMAVSGAPIVLCFIAPVAICFVIGLIN